MEDVLTKLNQHFHNKGIDTKARYILLKSIFQYYIMYETYEGCEAADPEVIELLESVDLHSGDAIQAFFMKFGETYGPLLLRLGARMRFWGSRDKYRGRHVSFLRSERGRRGNGQAQYASSRGRTHTLRI